jgi:hypothetical protein
MIKKADIALFFIILILGLAVSFLSLRGNSDGNKVIVTVNGEIYGTYDLSKNQIIEISQNDHTNNITIKDGTVSMSYSDCKNQTCVNTGSISQTKDTIACLPNKVLIEIENTSQGGDIDVISG